MLTREQFTEKMNALRELENNICEVNAALKKLSPDFGGFSIDATNMIVDLLSLAMDEQGEMIPYFIWELDWGEKWEPGDVTGADGTEYPLGTIDQLYDYLTLP